jgi:hypothetical protein
MIKKNNSVKITMLKNFLIIFIIFLTNTAIYAKDEVFYYKPKNKEVTVKQSNFFFNLDGGVGIRGGTIEEKEKAIAGGDGGTSYSLSYGCTVGYLLTDEFGIIGGYNKKTIITTITTGYTHYYDIHTGYLVESNAQQDYYKLSEYELPFVGIKYQPDNNVFITLKTGPVLGGKLYPIPWALDRSVDLTGWSTSLGLTAFLMSESGNSWAGLCASLIYSTMHTDVLVYEGLGKDFTEIDIPIGIFVGWRL